MSNVYISEPATSGKVIMHTSYGDLEIELWCKETPKACRNFIQLCLEGYYNNTIFHRIINGFCVQGGDPTGTGQGGSSIYGGPFPNEPHSRIRFSRRGLLAMANSGKNDNQSQFFFTLKESPELDRQNTLFGKIVGETVFNLLKIGEMEVDANEKPLYPPKIKTIEVMSHIFEDIIPREIEKEIQKPAAILVKRPEKSIKNNKSLLSFEEGEEIPKEFKIKSSHDVLKDDPRLSKKLAVNIEKLEVRKVEKAGSVNETTCDFLKPAQDEVLTEVETMKADRLDKVNKEIIQMKSEIRKIGVNHPEESAVKTKKPISYIEEQRLSYSKKSKTIVGRRHKGPQDDLGTLSALNEFKNRLLKVDVEEEIPSVVPVERPPCFLHSVINCKSCRDTFGQQLVYTDEGWLSHKLVFEKDGDFKEPGTNPYELVVIDPLAKQAKEQLVKEKMAQKDK